MDVLTSTTSPPAGIGARLYHQRTRRNWSREELAFHAGVSASAVFQIERRGAQPRRATVKALADAFGISVADLMNEDGRGAANAPAVEKRDGTAPHGRS